MSASVSPSSTRSQTISLLDRLFPPPRPFAVRLWDGTELPAGEESGFTVVLNHPGALRRMFTPPLELALGESFIYGDFDLEGDLFGAMALMETVLGQNFPPVSPLALLRAIRALPKADNDSPLDARQPARMRGNMHSQDRDRTAVQYHYDVGNDFYSLWLDRNLQYSCAYFHTGDEDLDAAQIQKMEHLCRKLRLQPGERLLDIGCGWGGLVRYAAEHYGVQAVGITLSENQAAYAIEQIRAAGLSDQVEVRLQDYRDLHGESFDKIVSVGMFEHVGRSRLPEYYAQAYRLLRPGGLFLNHGIASRAPQRYVMDGNGAAQFHARRESLGQRLGKRFVLGSGGFIHRYVFPDGEVIPVSEANRVAEYAGFEVRDVESLREHYALTLRHWVQRLEAHRDEAIRTSSEVTYRVWRLYMAACSYGFTSGANNIYQSLLVKSDHGQIGLPWTRADLYQVEEPETNEAVPESILSWN